MTNFLLEKKVRVLPQKYAQSTASLQRPDLRNNHISAATGPSKPLKGSTKPHDPSAIVTEFLGLAYGLKQSLSPDSNTVPLVRLLIDLIDVFND